jgi:hypothetical protein
MLNRTPRVGQEISAYCGKCKMERTHSIHSMDAAGAVKRVICTTCNAAHAYRQKPAEPAAGAAVKKTTGRSRSKDSNAYSVDPKRPIKSYNWDTNFSAGDVINHPKFGLGSVELTRPPNKMEVRFPEGKKVLLHNMKDLR